MDPKLAILFLLIGTVLGLSYLGGDHQQPLPRESVRRRWREFMPGRRKS